MPDITTKEDIKTAVDQFYQKVRLDPLLGPIFDQIMEVAWETHLPKMYAFWETVLLGQMSFKGNPALKYLIVHQKVGLDQKHFDRWLSLWQNTLNQHFEGSCTETAKQRAQHISQVLLLHIKKS